MSYVAPDDRRRVRVAVWLTPVSFYQSHSFEVMSEWRTRDGGATFWAMRRMPQH
jgi:hypothetical protein